MSMQNHHLHDIILSIPFGVFAALLAYRSHYASIFDYRTNHLYLPWSSTHRSLNIEASTPGEEAPTDEKTYRFKCRGNIAAVAWPRRLQSVDISGGTQTTGTKTEVAKAGDLAGAHERLAAVPQSMRRRPRLDFLNRRLARPPSLRYRKTVKAKYSFPKRAVWYEDAGIVDQDRDATLRPARPVVLSEGTGRVGRKRANEVVGRGSAGAMV